MSLFTNLAEIAVEKERISETHQSGKWTARKYSTKLGEGVMLMTANGVHPKSLTLDVKQEGWHRIYLGMIQLLATDTYTHIKLSSDDGFVGIKPFTERGPARWMSYEYAVETYWKSADLTNQQIIIENPITAAESSSALLWIRCEKMTDEEINVHNEIINNKNKCIQAHFDPDPYGEIEFNSIDECLVKLYALKDSNVDFCILETWDREDVIEKNEEHIFERKTFFKEPQLKKFNVAELYRKYIDVAHKYGLQLYSAERMCMSNFDEGVVYYYKKKFILNNPQYYYKNRDGSTVKACSYAYPEVQNYVLNKLKNDAEYGFDGITMIFHRGVHIGFEKPVIDKFKEMYPDVDPRLLPFSDSRLHGVWCEFMTDFMRKARKVLGENIKINVITDYGLATSKHLGLDVEQWAKEGLIDSASQGDMEIFENLDGCMDGDIINMEKYIEKMGNEPVVKRHYSTNVELVCSHINEYTELEKKYGVKAYHVLPWIRSLSLEAYNNAIEAMQNCGAKRFLAWNTNHMVYDLPETKTVFSIGDVKKENIELVKVYRMLSYNNDNISQGFAHWKG